MKPLGVVFAVMLAVSTALAQHGGGHSGGGHSGGGHAGGGGSHSGGGHAGGYHGSGGGGSVSGHGGFSGGGSYGRSGRVYIAPAYSYGYYAPLGYSGAYGAGYGSNYADTGYGYAAPAPPPVEDAPPPPPQEMDFGPNGGQPDPPPTEDGALRIYTAPAPSPQDVAMSEGRYYLIAYKDHSVYTALAFWMENGALNYVTPQNTHNQVSLDRVDLALTKRMNSRPGLSFNLPTP